MITHSQPGLMLTRRPRQRVLVTTPAGETIEIEFHRHRGTSASLRVDAPQSCQIVRPDAYDIERLIQLALDQDLADYREDLPHVDPNTGAVIDATALAVWVLRLITEEHLRKGAMKCTDATPRS